MLARKSEITFWLPPKGSLEPNSGVDPLKYYYHPLVGPPFIHRINHCLSLLSPPYQSVLEVGYGSGVLLPTLSLISKRVVGIDILAPPQNLKQNLTRLGVKELPELLTGHLETIPFSDSEFDLVLAISVFEHIADPIGMLDKIHKILKLGGTFLVGMPRVDPVMEVLFDLIGFKNIADHHCTMPTQFVQFAQQKFTLAQFRKFPAWSAAFFPFYFSMLFRKS